jgi:hypothetical protein
VRIIKSGNPEFDRDVALYTNTQNPVTKRDLHSGRDEQRFYYKAFGDLKHPWFLEVKRGSWATLEGTEQDRFKGTIQGRGARPKRQLSNEHVLRAGIAFICQDRVVAKTDKSQWWEKKFYDEVYRRQRSAYELASIALIYKALENLKRMKDTSGQALYPTLSYSVPHLCVLTKYAIDAKYPTMGNGEWEIIYDNLMDDTRKYPRNDSFVKDMVDSIFVHFLDEVYLIHRTAAQAQTPPQDWDAGKYFKTTSKWNGAGVAGAFLPHYRVTLNERAQQNLPSPESFIP